MTALPRDIFTFNVFRIIGGVGVGLCSIASPLYIAEVAPARSRGGLGFMYQLAIVAGCVLSILVAYCFAGWLPATTSWRWMFGSELVAILGFLAFLVLVPETPRWLAAHGMESQALSVLERIGGMEYAQHQMQEIHASLSEETGKWQELLEPGMKRALTVGILLAVFNNYTGWSGIYSYLPTIFQQAGFATTTSAIFQYLLAYTFMGAMTLVACLVVDRVGRRPLWIGASALMIVANLLAGCLFQLNVSGIPVLLAVCLLAIPHSFALGPLPWLMMSELYPTRIRAGPCRSQPPCCGSRHSFPCCCSPSSRAVRALSRVGCRRVLAIRRDLCLVVDVRLDAAARDERTLPGGHRGLMEARTKRGVTAAD